MKRLMFAALLGVVAFVSAGPAYADGSQSFKRIVGIGLTEGKYQIYGFSPDGKEIAVQGYLSASDETLKNCLDTAANFALVPTANLFTFTAKNADFSMIGLRRWLFVTSFKGCTLQ